MWQPAGMGGDGASPRERIQAWVAAYERAWRTPGTAALAELFAPHATYQTAPFEPPFRGLTAIAAMWEAGRDGADELFTMTGEVIAAEGATGVVRVEVVYGEPRPQTYRDLWVVVLGDDGRCVAFEEWPFWPSGSGGGFHAGPAG